MTRDNIRFLLRPGMRIKRWLVSLLLGVIIIGLALAMGTAWIYSKYDFPSRLKPYTDKLTLQFIEHPWREFLIASVGITVLAMAGIGLWRSIASPMMAADRWGKTYTEALIEERFGPQEPVLNVVAIGGGTGLSSLLRGLKKHNINLTAIVTVADNGGSTGRLRNVFNMPAPGDIRNCLVAMADDENLMAKLFHYRFDREGSELTGHAFGNLFITALTQVTGSFEQGVIESAQVLNVRGRVLPSTLEIVDLCAEMEEGYVVRGESELSHKTDKITEVFLDPLSPKAYQPAIEAILAADLIVLGPGSLYTSVVPNLLIDGIKEAMYWSQAAIAYVCNVATQHGETDNMGYEEHIRQIAKYLGESQLDYAIVNNHAPTADEIRPEWQIKPIAFDEMTTIVEGAKIIAADVVNDNNALRHDPAKLANLLINLAQEHKLSSELAGISQIPSESRSA